MAALVTAALVVVVPGCGDDDDDETVAETTTTEEAAVDGDWCADVAEVQSIEPDIPEDASEQDAQRIGEEFFTGEFLPMMRQVAADAPAAAKDEATVILEFAEEKGGRFFEDPGFQRVEAKANQAAADACGLDATTVTAVDYAFQGSPATLDEGLVYFRFDNRGAELHEMVLIRKKADTTETFDELLAGPVEVARQKTELSGGGAFAFPGAGDTTIMELEAGEYAMVCFIPVGLTPEKAEGDQPPDGPPHVTRGMKSEFMVS